MTAQVRILGTGRVLNHPELVGRSLCYFLSVTFAGRTYRWAFPSARDVWVEEVEGEQYHFQGMDYPQLSQAFDFNSDSPVDISVSFEDLSFPGDVDLPELLAQGHRLERCEAELSALPDHPDALWSARQIILVGEVREPVYGDPETHPNMVGFTVDSPSWEDVALFPPDDWVVTEEAWPDAHESAIGKVFPFVFGQPGWFNASGILGRLGSPGICVRDDRYMFAGHLVAPNTYDPSIFIIQNFVNVTSGEVYQAVFGSGSTTPVLELATSASGFQYTDANFVGETNYTQGDEIWISAWSYQGATTLANTRSLGGYPNFEWDGPLTTAGDLLYFMLLQSSLKVDRGRTAVAQALLQAYRLSGYIDERVSPYEWITDNLLPILPIAMSQGPKGVFPVVWRYDAGPNDAVGHFIEGPRWRRVSGVERDDSNIFNKYTLSYALDGSDFLLKFGVDGALETETDTTETGATYVPNIYARRSYLEHGTIAVDESSDIVTTQDTAAAICAWKIRANAQAKRIVTYEATAEHAWLEPGDPILVTDPDIYFDEQVCLVRTKTWDVTSVLYELLILTDPVRDAVPAERSYNYTLISFDFETLGEGGAGGSFANQGTASFSAAVEGGSAMRDTSVVYEGNGSCHFNSSVPNSFGFSLGGSTMLDLGSSPTVRIRYRYYPLSFSVSQIVWGWGQTVSNRFLLNIDNGLAECTTVRSGVVTSRVSAPTTMTLNTWNYVEILLHAGSTTIYLNGVRGETETEAGPIDVATFGNAVRWGREPFTSASWCDGYLDNFTLEVG